MAAAELRQCTAWLSGLKAKHSSTVVANSRQRQCEKPQRRRRRFPPYWSCPCTRQTKQSLHDFANTSIISSHSGIPGRGHSGTRSTPDSATPVHSCCTAPRRRSGNQNQGGRWTQTFRGCLCPGRGACVTISTLLSQFHLLATDRSCVPLFSSLLSRKRTAREPRCSRMSY